MGEEKRLDEKELEQVAGGAGISEQWTKEEWTFICYNCIVCRHDGPGTCPYGNDRKAAFQCEGATCSKKEPLQ